MTTRITRFFGDGEHTFQLTGKLIVEFETKAGAGIGAIFARLGARAFRHSDIIETIRLGLIGGGMAPLDAARLVTTYGADRPLAETLPVALAIMEAVFFGAPSPASGEPSDD